MSDDGGTAWTIRDFRPADQAACERLYHHALIGGQIAENDTGLDIDDIEAAYVKPQDNHFWVAEARGSGAVVGMIGVQHFEDGCAEIRRLRVDLDHRGQGIGSALVETAVRFCHEHGYLKITLDTFVQREPVLRLFQQFHFKYDRSREIAGKEMMYFYLDLYEGDPRTGKGE